ncbi:DGQHR domain-containing protein DpdB [Piscinibacter sp.]|uniref:DGQHR domain-containing protein DpdB n=1 Tax=Piscinibacter sp. TaxID=1903157 RepID=UPI00258AB0CB|nr:DGQHR domain-containing protein DpdB [Piscinibacter sp.]
MNAIAKKRVPAKARPPRASALVMNALLFKQGNAKVFSFVMPGAQLTQIADLSRIKRDEKKDKLQGFQRAEIQKHVREITEYLDRGPALFPNAVILALSPEVPFTRKRGTKTAKLNVSGVEAGTLSIPVRAEGEKVAWVVDGQQRSLALGRSKNGSILVPVVAFESSSIETHRQQFILVNRAKGLSQRLVNELLPETDDALLPRDLVASRVPSELCNLLNVTSKSPFFHRISRISEKTDKNAIIDSAVIRMIRDRVNGTSGALLHLKGNGRDPANVREMYRLLAAYWSAVAATFPEAWALPPDKSRLTSAAGISVMGVMMDRICARVGYRQGDLDQLFRKELSSIARQCAWTSGRWPEIGMEWNALESTSKSVARVVQHLGATYVRAGAA